MAALAAAVSLAVVMPGTASATPPSGVHGRILNQKTVRGTDYVLREVTIDPAGTTGWHYHDGTVYAVVRAGVLTHTEDDCTTTNTYRAGSVLVEESGRGNVHVGRNLGSVPVVLEVIYIKPAGSPLFRDAPNPRCGLR